MCYEYTGVIREGARAMVRLLPDGASRDAFVLLALSPFKNSRKRLWRWPDVFSFTPHIGMWGESIVPAVEEQLEFARIGGSASLRSAPPIVGTSTNIHDAGKRNKKTKKEKEGTAPLRAALPMQFPPLLARTPLIPGGNHRGRDYDRLNSKHRKTWTAGGYHRQTILLGF